MNGAVVRPRAVALASLLPIVAFLVLSMSGAHKPLHLDSMEFAAAASAAAETGRPVFYKSEESAKETALWHPPLYVHLLAGWYKILGAGEAQGRAFGMLCALWQGAAVLWIVQVLFGPLVRRAIEPWFWTVFLLNPYTIQTAAVLDIDSTIYGPLLCLLLLAALRLTWRDGERRRDEPGRMEYAWISLALAAVCWAKLTTVLLAIPFVGLLLIPRFGFWRAARIAISVIAAGLGVFLGSYFAYGALLKLDVKHTFAFLLYSYQVRGSSGGRGLAARIADFRTNLASMAPFHVEWTGLLPWIVATGVFLRTAWTARRTRSERALHYLMLLALAGGTTLYYCGRTQTFGLAPFKYTYVFWGLVLTAPLLLLAWGWGKLQPARWGGLQPARWGGLRPARLGGLQPARWGGLRPARLGGLQPAITTLHAGPPETPLAGGRAAGSEPGEESPGGHRPVHWLAAALFLAAAWYGRYRLADRQILQWGPAKWENLIPVLLTLPALFAGTSGRGWRAAPRILFVAGLAAWAGLGLGIGVYQTTAPYSTTYDYGLSGAQDAAAFLRHNTSPTEMFGAMKDLGYLTRRRYYDNYPGLFGGPEATRRFIEIMAAGKMKYVVFTTRGQDRLFLNPALEAWVKEHCALAASFGDYRIYTFNPTPAGAQSGAAPGAVK